MIHHRWLPLRWRRLSAWCLPIGLLLFISSLLPQTGSYGTELGGLPDREYDAFAVFAIALECLALALCRRWPAGSLALVWTGFSIEQLRTYHSMAGVALPFVLVVAGGYLERRRRLAAALFSVWYVLLVVGLSRLGGDETLTGFCTFYLALVLACGAGAWLRSTRAAEAERRRHLAEETRSAERARIARELHDVVTHHVTAMVVQAEAARYLTATPDRVDEALSTVGDTGRAAITDLRRLLDVLNPDHGTDRDRPPAGRLRDLVEQTRRAGQPVEFTEQGGPAGLTGSAGLVAYRVVQESLTNALKYAHGSRTSVLVRHGDAELTVQVATDGSGSPAASPGGSGRGLAGLRERVGGLGGEFVARPGDGGGFVVRARIPAGSRS